MNMLEHWKKSKVKHNINSGMNYILILFLEYLTFVLNL